MPLSGVSTRSAPDSARPRASPLPIDLVVVIAIAAALIVLRSLSYLLFEQFGFDSDQAINGLMAKHLGEGRAFPLFFYGQTYMLAVESWVAVPFFWIAGPTVAALRTSLLAWNLAFASLLIAGLHRDDRLEWRLAIVPALFFLAAPPSIAKQLIEAQGGIIEPFVYIAALWFLRRRPIWFGIVLAIGFRNREFTLYAVPVLLAIELAAGELTWARLRQWLLALVMFSAAWESISALMPFADLAGPGTRGQLLGGFSGSQLGNLLNRFNGGPGAIVERASTLLPRLLAWFVGGTQVETSFALPDRRWVARLAATLLVAIAARLLWLIAPPPAAWRDRRSAIEALRIPLVRASFAWYILGVGAVASVTFMMAKPTLTGYSRYAILGLLLPVGATAALLALEPQRIVRSAVTALVIAWAAVSVADNVSVLMSNIRQPPPNPIRTLTDGLIARHVPVASANYWEAYIATFVARERVRIASNDFVRIQEYQDFLAEHLRDARVLTHDPCPGADRIDRWYVCRP
ncbi:MAG TPA: hypothetical protein VKD69_10900 [Vicinamibacterales bacterium]|nr:hypothetical protein [Vicinamibacterales bacterium]